jgi:hypothetical protein
MTRERHTTNLRVTDQTVRARFRWCKEAKIIH